MEYASTICFSKLLFGEILFDFDFLLNFYINLFYSVKVIFLELIIINLLLFICKNKIYTFDPEIHLANNLYLYIL